MLRSAVKATGGKLLAAILTGMGHDGLAGCRAVAAAGGEVLAQDEASSVVWGCPVPSRAPGCHRFLRRPRRSPTASPRSRPKG